MNNGINLKKHFTQEEYRAILQVKKRFPTDYDDLLKNLIRIKVAVNSLNKPALERLIREKNNLIAHFFNKLEKQ